jgi:threonine dehydrogenase-like Zn-dependent dehydrogenase
MQALTWQGVSDVRVDEVPDPQIQDPTDIIVRITSTGLCGSDLHLYAGRTGRVPARSVRELSSDQGSRGPVG